MSLMLFGIILLILGLIITGLIMCLAYRFSYIISEYINYSDFEFVMFVALVVYPSLVSLSLFGVHPEFYYFKLFFVPVTPLSIGYVMCLIMYGILAIFLLDEYNW